MTPDLWTHDGSSFYDLAREHAPHALPATPVGDVVHGTTVLALRFADGVVVAGDRRATMGNLIAQRDLRKLEPADAWSCVAFAGAVGIAKELVALFQLELEHYEKIENTELSFPAKVNRVSRLVRGNLPAAMQGLGVSPLLVGWDHERAEARVFTFDPTGSAAEQREFGGTGSGWYFAKGSLKKLYRPDLTRTEAITTALQALTDAADDDSATGGPDRGRAIYPTVATITAEGYADVPDAEVAEHA